ncbi:alpha/beta fold hydrolase [Pseudooctadecabacter jejudonensis]|uniref:3-oxoadipate enol-lactonase 2 n=1 Tax=Pseudooctadecabacter jejudonensis TaxID=1391910 RepID=A0A1Y5SSZ7_9RHOB|nr:alpha/beta fold hydrolase [Pseudooctadecabacter jejudonensis]SLN44541.1 3-oxoadipate enol-lactonase 2 [Pseudooctadecabacter jejudonensis]
MATSSVHVVRKIAASREAVWAVLGTFDVSWHPAVASCDLLRSPDGALLRSFTDLDGQPYEERRTYVSDTDRVLCYTALRGINGLLNYAARVEVTGADGGCVVTWHADIAASADRIDGIAAGTEAIFEAGLDALDAKTTSKSIPRPKLQRGDVVPDVTVIGGLPELSVRHGGQKAQSDTLVLFLHGIGGNATNWDAQVTALAAQYNVAAMDLRGYGGSSLGTGPSQIDDYCDDILFVMTAFGASRLVLVGLSYGSWIGTSFAMRHSDKLVGLVLAGGCTGMSEADPRERETFRVSREVPLDAGQTPADFAPAVVDIIAGPDATEAQRDAMRASMAAIPSATYRDALQCFTNPLEQFDFSKIDCPVLLMTGEHDKLAPPAEIRRVSERIADARTLNGRIADVQFEVIAGAGHICNLEAPAVTNDLLHRFLSRLPDVAVDYKASLPERQREKADRIRQAAHDEFCENGFDGASMDRIANRADVSKPTLYQYFGGKDVLLEAVLDQARTQIVAPLMAKDGPLVERLWRFSWVYADFVLRPDMLSLARLILGEASRRPETAIAYHQNGPARAFEGLVDFINDAVRSGEIQTDAPDLAAQNLWSLILSGPRDRYLHYAEERPTQDELLRSIGHGLWVFLKAYGTDPQAQLATLDSFISAKTDNLHQQVEDA